MLLIWGKSTFGGGLLNLVTHCIWRKTFLDITKRVTGINAAVVDIYPTENAYCPPKK